MISRNQLVSRILQIIIVLFGVSFITFLLTYLAPGDPVTAMYEAVGIVPTDEMVATAKSQMGLDQPFFVQYFIWLSNCLRGDLGTSFSQHLTVIDLLKKNLGATLKLAFLSLFLTILTAVPLGILSAVRQDKLSDYFIRGLSFIGISLPGFWIGLMLLYVFAYKLNLVPVISSGGGLEKMILPAVTLAIAMSSKYTRQVRTAFLEELSHDYVIGARTRGVSEARILWRHILPNAMLPLITLLGLSLGSLLGGTVVVEMIFSYPGLGKLAVEAVSARDYPLIQGIVLWIALIYMLINLAVDISYRYIDPRIRNKGAV